MLALGRFFKGGAARTIRLKKNIIFGFLFQGISILTSFALVPLTIDVVDVKQYGIWLTITSIVSWFNLLDFGLGSGVKNKLAGSLAKNDLIYARTIVSTGYFALTLLLSILTAAYILLSHYVSWGALLGIDGKAGDDISIVFNIIIIGFFIRFQLSLLSSILNAVQLPSVVRLLGTLSNVVILVVIWMMIKFKVYNNIVGLSVAYSFIPIAITISATFYFFSKRLKHLRPKWSLVRLSEVKNIYSLGVKFFIIQLSGVILFGTGNVIIMRFYSAEAVPVFNVAYKLFAVLSLGYDIIITPFWVVYTDAWTKREYDFIRRSNKKLLALWGLLALGGGIILIFSDLVYKLWIGTRLEVPFEVSLFSYLYFITFTFGGVFNVFINGTGKVLLQIICLVISALLYIPMIYFLARVMNMGVQSVFIALIFVNFYSIFVAPIQFHKLISGKAKGVFNR